MNNPPTKPWAKLLANNPDKESILLFGQFEEPSEGQIKTGCQISQKSPGDVWIRNLSTSPIKIGDDWLEVNEEKEISHGETVSFNKDKENDDGNFEYVFLILNSPSKNVNKRDREERVEPQTIAPNPETVKLTKVSNQLEQELACSICTKIPHKCATLSPCQHIFCSFCLLRSLQNSVKCPNCRVDATSVAKSFVLQNLVEVTLENFPNKKRPKEEIEHKQIELEGTIVKGMNWTYIGAYHNGKREGKGIIIYSKGNIYEGTWQNDNREGRGVLTFPSGKIYKGEWLNDVVQNIGEIIIPGSGVYKGETERFIGHGKGVFEFNNGDIYDGYFVEGLLEGFGKRISLNGDEYEGNWVKGKREGYGTMKYSEGNQYVGEWRANQYEGYGVETLPDGERHEGFFVNGLAHGKGKYRWADGQEYDGDWIEGEHHGIGIMKYTDGQIYEGEWKDDSREGSGILTLANGDKYEGIWAQDDLQSLRKIYYANGDIYEGAIELENLQKHGQGVMTYENGDKYEGNWLNDKQHGKGKEVCRGGKLIFEGVWEEGKIVGDIIMTNGDGARYQVEFKKLIEEEQIENEQGPLEENRERNEQNS